MGSPVDLPLSISKKEEYRLRLHDYLQQTLDDSVVPELGVVKKGKPIMVECIVRGYLWGSMAGLYEQGERIICGMKVPDGLLKFQKFDHPLFTPTTKAPEGAHDENITFEEMVKIVGKRDLAEKLKDISVKLYERGAKLAREKGLILIDTKYEFGLDPETGDVLVMDEVNTPDSSRICEVKEWEEKYNKIADLMKNGKYKNSSDVLANNPSLKIKEFSKQYVRDVLLEQGFLPDQNTPPKLTDEQVVECAYRYICVYEKITGQTFVFPDASVSPKNRLISSLITNKFIKGCAVIIMAGSDSDSEHLLKIQKNLNAYKIPSIIRICSAHKQCSKLEAVLDYYNRSIEPLLIIACAGGTDALSGAASFLSVFPVVSCPPDGMNSSCLSNPPGSSNAFILRPDNIAKFALQMFSSVNNEFRKTCLETAGSKIKKLVKADGEFLEMAIKNNQTFSL